MTAHFLRVCAIREICGSQINWRRRNGKTDSRVLTLPHNGPKKKGGRAGMVVRDQVQVTATDLDYRLGHIATEDSPPTIIKHR